MLQQVGAPQLPNRNPPNIDHNPGSDGEVEAEAADIDELPTQVDDDDNDQDAPDEEEDPNPHLNDLIDEAVVEGLETMSLSVKNNMTVIGTATFHAHHIVTSDQGPNDVQNAAGVVVFLAPGTDLSSLQIQLGDNLRDFEINADGAPELSNAIDVLPPRDKFRDNDSLWEPIRQATQLFLNKLPKSHAGSVTMGSKGRVPCKVTSDGIIKPSKLKLKIKKDWGTSFLPEEQGDRWLLYKIPFQDRTGNVPAYISIGFFLEDMGEQNKSTPSKNIRRTLPGESPPSSGRCRVRQRGSDDSMDTGENFMSPNNSPSAAGATGAAVPDQASSSWFGTRRTG